MKDKYEKVAPFHKNRNVGAPNENFDISVAPIPFSRVAGEPYLPEHDTPVDGGGRGAVRFSSPKNALGLPAHHRQAIRPGAECRNPENRLLDMDDEGRDVDFMFPGAWVASVQKLCDPTVSEGIYRAFHRFLSDYCSVNPDRLKCQAQLPANDVEWSIAELKTLAKEKWLAGAWVHLPENMPIDDPTLEPLWATIERPGSASGASQLLCGLALVSRRLRHVGQLGHRPDGGPPLGRPPGWSPTSSALASSTGTPTFGAPWPRWATDGCLTGPSG